MKSLNQFEAVINALSQVAAETDINNGTNGIELVIHFWEQESVRDQKRVDLETEIAKAVINGQLDKVELYQTQLKSLPRPKINTVWKVLTPIPRIQGTKTLHDGQKTYRLSMENVTTLYIPEDAIKLDLVEYEETADMGKDAMGRDAVIIKLRIKKGIIDVAAPITDRKGNVLRAKRAYITPISYKAMQIAGKIINQESNEKQRRYGFDEQQA